VKKEETVWEIALKWLLFDKASRKIHVKKLLESIRLGLIEINYFLENIKGNDMITYNEECRPIIINTLKFLYDLDTIITHKGEVPTPEIARPRIPHEIIFAIGGWSGGSPTSTIETYDTRADRWIQVPEVDPAGPRAYHGTAVVGHEIIVVGGFNGNEYFNTCRSFNAITKEWKELAPMNARRCYVSIATLNDDIYAMGGYDGNHRLNTVERYNKAENQWSFIHPMNFQRSDACATVLFVITCTSLVVSTESLVCVHVKSIIL